MTEETLIDFPCHFPIKIIGINSDVFFEEVQAITREHFPDFTEDKIAHNKSKNSSYLAITVTVFATNKIMLDAYYMEISKLSGVKMVL